MAALGIALLISIGLYIGVISLLPKDLLEDRQKHVRSALKRVATQSGSYANPYEESIIINNDQVYAEPIVKLFMLLPGSSRVAAAVEAADMTASFSKYLLGSAIFFAICIIFCARFGALGLPIALVIGFLGSRFYLNRQIKKRKKAFMEAFPEAIDIIVRSVRSGYPLTSALGIVAENMVPPVSTEFKKVVDETRFGYSLPEALNRLTQRIDDVDVSFFTVVLAVQQEAGGNLGEVLTNLSGIIRKRRQMKLKIKALSSEGRATSYVLGALPVFIFGILYFVAPTHLTPLWTTTAGYAVCGAVIGLIATGMFVVRAMINIDI